MDDSSNEEEDTCSSSSETTDSDEHVVNEGLLETITEEDQDRITGSSVHSSEGLNLIITVFAYRGPEITFACTRID